MTLQSLAAMGHGLLVRLPATGMHPALTTHCQAPSPHQARACGLHAHAPLNRCRCKLQHEDPAFAAALEALKPEERYAPRPTSSAAAGCRIGAAAVATGSRNRAVPKTPPAAKRGKPAGNAEVGRGQIAGRES